MAEIQWLPPHSEKHPNSISWEATVVQADGKLRWTAFIQDHRNEHRYSVRAYYNDGKWDGCSYGSHKDVKDGKGTLDQCKAECERLLSERAAFTMADV